MVEKGTLIIWITSQLSSPQCSSHSWIYPRKGSGRSRTWIVRPPKSQRRGEISNHVLVAARVHCNGCHVSLEKLLLRDLLRDGWQRWKLLFGTHRRLHRAHGGWIQGRVRDTGHCRECIVLRLLFFLNFCKGLLLVFRFCWIWQLSRELLVHSTSLDLPDERD